MLSRAFYPGAPRREKRPSANNPPAVVARLCAANRALVHHIAAKYSSVSVPLEDRVAEGNVGLVIAATRYSEGSNAKFSTYAGWWIAGLIRRAVVRETRHEHTDDIDTLLDMADPDAVLADEALAAAEDAGVSLRAYTPTKREPTASAVTQQLSFNFKE